MNDLAVAIVAGGRTVAVLFGIDDAVAAVRHGIRVAAFAQVLVPDGAVRTGAVEQESHLAGGELCGGLLFRIGGAVADAAADALIAGAFQPVAVVDGASVAVGADAAHVCARAGDRACMGAVGDGAAAAGATADSAHVFAATGDRAGVGATGDGAATSVVGADAARIFVAGARVVDRAVVGAAGDGATVVVTADAAHIIAITGDGAILA